MSLTKYLLFLCVGNRMNIAARVKDTVRRSNLAMLVPMIKFENGRDRQFYLGLALQLEDPSAKDAPAAILQLCQEAGLGRPVGQVGSRLVDASQINAHFMSGSIAWQAFNDSIRFENSPTQLPEDLGLLETVDGNELGADTWDKLLWWCSAQGEASFQLFRTTASLLAASDHVKPWPLMRRLLIQGHIEVEGTRWSDRWCANAPSFICPTNGRAFLIGRRTPRYLAQVEDIVPLDQRSLPSAPALITADPRAVLAKRGSLESIGLSVATSPSEAWARESPTWQEFFASLERDPDVREHSESFRAWNGTTFVPASPSESGVGLYEIESQRGPDVRTRLFDGNAWLAGAFYDLKWVLSRMVRKDMNAMLTLDGTLLVPEAERWPLLYERAVVLGSGRLPQRLQDGSERYLGYPGVAPGAVSMLCEKLGIKLKKESVQ